MNTQEPKPQQVRLEISNSLRTLTGWLVAIDKAHCILTVSVENDADLLKLDTEVSVIGLAGETPFRVSALVRSRSGSLVQLRLVKRRDSQERRRARRYPVAAHATVELPHGEILSVQVADLSTCGAGLRVAQELKVGQSGRLLLSLAGSRLTLGAVFEVRHSRQIGPGEWFLGVQFTEVSRLDQQWLSRLFPK